MEIKQNFKTVLQSIGLLKCFLIEHLRVSILYLVYTNRMREEIIIK